MLVNSLLAVLHTKLPLFYSLRYFVAVLSITRVILFFRASLSNCVGGIHCSSVPKAFVLSISKALEAWALHRIA